MIQKWLLALLPVLLVAATIRADDRLIAPVANDLNGTEVVQLPGEIPGINPDDYVIDTVVGDTIQVGASAWDDQHNSNAARQICATPSANWLAQVVFTKLSGSSIFDPRHVRTTRVREDGDGNLEVSPVPTVQVDDYYRTGYTGITYNQAANTPVMVMHGQESQFSFLNSYAAVSDPDDPNAFNFTAMPFLPFVGQYWPRVVSGEDSYVHMMTHGSRINSTDPITITYMRYSLDEATHTLSPATPFNVPVLLTDQVMNMSGDVAVSENGQQVAVGACLTRHETLGETWGGLTATQVNNDVYVYLSDDGGWTWSPNDRKNVTQFIEHNYVDPGDTMRAYADCSLEYAYNDLRVAFTAAHGNAITGESFYESRVYCYTQSVTGEDLWSLIHFEPDPGYPPEAWGRTADSPSLYFDVNSGILWCLFRAFGGGIHDYGENSGMGNGDLYISASPPGIYNGLLWTKPVNITNSNWTEPGGAPISSCRSEMDATIAENSNGDYLQISYLIDIDAGTAVANPQEGAVTNNPYVYHRILKDDLLREFEIEREWVQNYPLHVDSTGFWQDPGNWEWSDYGGFFTGFRRELPVSLTMTEINFTIPPEGGVGTYSTDLVSSTGNTYSNVTFWTKITTPTGQVIGPLVLRTFNLSPFMEVHVDEMSQSIPANGPGGTYYLTGYLGYYPNSYVHDSIQFFKFGDTPDEFEYDPAQWWFSDFPVESVTADEETGSVQPVAFALREAWPNPFNAATSISVTLPRAAVLQLTVYDVTGRQVAQLADGWTGAGEHTFAFDGSELASGVYFVRASVPGEPTLVRKVALVK